MNPQVKALGVIGGSIGALIVLLLVAVYFQDYLASRAIGPTGPRIAVKQGEAITANINTSSAPSVKVEICQERVQPARCATLAAKATGKEVVAKIPTNFPLGRALIKVTERDHTGRLTHRTQYQRPVMVVAGSATVSQDQPLQPQRESSRSGTKGPLTEEEIDKLIAYNKPDRERNTASAPLSVGIGFHTAWPSSDYERACASMKWKVDGRTVGGDDWYPDRSPALYGVLCNGVIDTRRLSLGQHSLAFEMTTEDGRLIAVEGSIVLVDRWD